MAFDCDVIVIGAGPTGVTLALLLAQRGVKVIVVEKEAEIYPLPRAAHIDHECMRILQEAGIADEVMKTSRRASRYDFLNARGQILLRLDGADRTGPGGWPIANMIHQPSVEAALRRSLATEATASLQRQWELKSFEDDGSGVTAHLASPEGERQVRARYLVGADGARSLVRKASSITFNDMNFEEPWLVVDVFVEDYSRLPAVNLQICNPERPTTCVLMGEGRHRWEFMILPGETAEQVSDETFIEKLLDPWQVKGAVRIERKAVYTFRARIARKWRKGRILLAGDAAHQMPPFAGQGMCSGLRDAANLAWKLAEVIAGRAPDGLLGTYQPEREPNVRATISTAIMMGRMVCMTSRWSAFLRDLKFAIARMIGRLPSVPSDYPPISAGLIESRSVAAGSYFPQFIAADGKRLDAQLGYGRRLLSRADLAAEDLAPFAGQLEEWFDKTGTDAVLVRPDHYVFATGAPANLTDAWDKAILSCL